MLKSLWILAINFAIIFKVALGNDNLRNLKKRDYSVILPSIEEKIPWLTKEGEINEDLFNIQALIIKDEEVGNDCKFKPNVLYS